MAKTIGILVGLIVGCAINPASLTAEDTLGEITGFSLGTPTRYSQIDGDIWNTTWADDGDLYTYGNDTQRFGGVYYGERNLAFGKLSGSDPAKLTATLLCRFDEYGSSTSAKGNWKASGLVCIEGILYLTIMKHVWEPDPSDNGVYYQVRDASIIKSSDHGQTWTRVFEENRDHPMFPGRRFSSPWFIQYGKNCTDVDAENLADRYVYAISTDGYYDSGNTWILGRVLKSKIGDLNGSDWQFYRGRGASGLVEANWTADVNAATPVITDRKMVCKTGIQYLRTLKRYVLIEWNYKQPYQPDQPHCSDTSYWYLWQSPAPWGPWTRLGGRQVFTSEGLYCPSICPKFIDADGLGATVIATGNWKQANEWGLRSQSDDPYTLWTVPLRFDMGAPRERVGFLEDGAHYAIVNTDTGAYLSPVMGTLGSPVSGSTSSGLDYKQLWRFEYLGEGESYYRIVHEASGLCLEMFYDRSIPKYVLRLGEYQGRDEQKWFVQCLGDGSYWLYAKRIDKLIGIGHSRPEEGSSIELREHRAGLFQRWSLKE